MKNKLTPKQALELIEYLSAEMEGESFNFDEPINKWQQKLFKFAGGIYVIAHTARKTPCMHDKWEKDNYNLYMKLKKYKAI